MVESVYPYQGRENRQILIYRIYYYGNRRQPYVRLPVFCLTDRQNIAEMI